MCLEEMIAHYTSAVPPLRSPSFLIACIPHVLALRRIGQMCQNKIQCLGFSTSSIEVQQTTFGLTFSCINIRKNGLGSILADDPEARAASSRSGAQSPLKLCDLSRTPRGFNHAQKCPVISLCKRDKIEMACLI